MSESSGLTHVDATGAARMVDVSGKEATTRTAVARQMRWHSDSRGTPALVAAVVVAKGVAGAGAPPAARTWRTTRRRCCAC